MVQTNWRRRPVTRAIILGKEDAGLGELGDQGVGELMERVVG